MILDVGNKFKQQKENALKGLKEAREKGDVDADMLPLIDYVNSLPDYYTTSTCTGRITLFHDPGSKKDSGWVGKWHRTVEFGEVMKALKTLPQHGTIWFLQEPTIIHINCRTLDDASRLVDLSRNAGYKKASILSFKDERIIVEINGTERINAPLAIDGQQIADNEYIRQLIEIANKKFTKGMTRLEKYLVALKELEKE